MLTRKQTFHHTAGKHHGNGSRNPSKVPATVVWSRLGPSTLLLAATGETRGQSHIGPPIGHLHMPMGTRKIVNPVTVNALKSLSARCPPSGTVATLGCTLGPKCCSCCYCRCDVDKPPPNQFRLNAPHHSSSQKNSRMSTCSEKSRRRRSRSRDKLLHHPGGASSYRQYSMDVRNLIDVGFGQFFFFKITYKKIVMCIKTKSFLIIPCNSKCSKYSSNTFMYPDEFNY